MTSKDQAPKTFEEVTADSDLVDRIFDYVVELIPEIKDRSLDHVKQAVRQEFAGDRVYIQARTSSSYRLAAQALELFNGRNATEVARKLQVSRATVYRLLKQPGKT